MAGVKCEVSRAEHRLKKPLTHFTLAESGVSMDIFDMLAFSLRNVLKLRGITDQRKDFGRQLVINKLLKKMLSSSKCNLCISCRVFSKREGATVFKLSAQHHTSPRGFL